MSKHLEKLREEMPLVFERRDNLVLQVAEATADYHLLVDRLREEGFPREQFERERAVAYDKFRGSIEPIRAEIDAITGRIADILAMYPPDPILIKS